MPAARSGSIAMNPMSAAPLVTATNDLAAVLNSPNSASTPSRPANSRERSTVTPAGETPEVRLPVSMGFPRIERDAQLASRGDFTNNSYTDQA